MSQRQIPGGGFIYTGSPVQRQIPGTGFYFVAEGGDTTAPILSLATATATGSSSLAGTVTTNEGNGTLYYLASINSSETALTVKSSTLTQTVSASGLLTVAISGLEPSTSYYIHYLHRDVANNDSAVLSSSSVTTDGVADTTAPILSSASATQIGSYSASGSVTTDENNGTLYFLASTNVSEVSSVVKASPNSQMISAIGPQSVSVTGLSPSTTYYMHYLHRDVAGNDSAVLSTTGFDTDPPPTSPSLLLKIQLMIGA